MTYKVPKNAGALLALLTKKSMSKNIGTMHQFPAQMGIKIAPDSSIVMGLKHHKMCALEIKHNYT